MNTVLLDKLRVTQVAKEFLTLYETRLLTLVLITACQWSTYWAPWIQCTSLNFHLKIQFLVPSHPRTGPPVIPIIQTFWLQISSQTHSILTKTKQHPNKQYGKETHPPEHLVLYKRLTVTNRNIILPRCNTRQQMNRLAHPAKHTAVRTLSVNYDLAIVHTSSEPFT